MFALLKSPTARRFFIAHFQSELGNGAAYVALVLVAYHRLHSAWAIALVLLADFLPGIVFAAPFGALADRMSRRRLAVGADILRASAFIALALLPSFGATVGLALLAGVGSAVFRPAVNAALPGLFTDERRSPAMALVGAGISIGITLGPALTALVLLFSSATVVLAANGVTFLLSAALLSTLPLGSGSRTDSDAPSQDERASVWSATVDGVRSAAQIRGVRTLLVMTTLSVLAGSLMNVAEPLLATGPLRAGNSGYSVLVAVYGVAMLVGSLVLARAGSSLGGLRGRLLLGLGLQGAGMVGSAAAPSLAWAAASFAVTGAGNALIVGADIRLVQELVHERLLGRVFGLRDMLANIAFVLAFLSAGVVLAALGIRAVFAVGGAALVMLAIAGLLTFRPDRSVEPIVSLPEPVGAS
ncbi:MAG TPA: MFS transporter [Solirubrobacteraceae bacterium]|nr:MFS transporter [Solirubrobacteraceae bacterium]